MSRSMRDPVLHLEALAILIASSFWVPGFAAAVEQVQFVPVSNQRVAGTETPRRTVADNSLGETSVSLLNDGSFENGWWASAWTLVDHSVCWFGLLLEDSIRDWSLVGYPNQHGSFAAAIEGMCTEDPPRPISLTLSQTVQLPANASRLRYYVWFDRIEPSDPQPDYFKVRLGNTVVDSVALTASNDTNGWAERDADISAFAGQQVTLNFDGVGAGPRTGLALLDNIRIETIDTPPPPPPPSASCAPSSSAACLNGGRFRAEISWRNYQGQTGTAQTVPFGTDDSALFWFFSADNWEMLVKVIDGCSLNDRFWVYSSASTDVEYTLTVTDTLTDTQKVYRNDLGHAAPANTDSAAFATCGENLGTPAKTHSATVGYAETISETVQQAGFDAELIEAAASTGACIPSDEEVCLEGGRFRVRVHWRDYQGHTGEGHSVPFGSGNSGLFWFFNSNNWEMLVKIVDGCTLNDRFWVFSSATTDVEYTLSVTDTFTGTTRDYTNPLGQRSPALNDTSAFATCAAIGAGHLELVTAPSVVLGSAGQTSDIEVRAVDAYGHAVPGASLTWTTTDAAVATVSPLGSLRARVTAQSAGPGSGQIVAKWGTFETRIDLLLARSRPGAVVLDGSLVLSRTESHVSLRRNAVTEALQSGQIVTSGGQWALLDRIGSKSLTAATVELAVSPTSYNQAFERLIVDSPGAPAVFVARLNRDGASYAFVRDASGKLQHVALNPMDASALTLSCKYTNGSPAPLLPVGTDIEITAPLSLHPSYDSSTGELELAVEGQARVTILSGELRYLSATSQAVSCSLSLPSIVLLRASIYGIGLSLDLKPVVGVSIQAQTTAGTLRITGPVASAVGSVTGGLRYRPGTGWSTFSDRSFSGGVTPSPLTSDMPSFTASVEAYAGAESSIKAYLGLPIEGFGLNLAELTFLELKGYARASLTLPSPVTPSSPTYSGPSWSAALGVKADLGVEISSGQLPKLLRYFDISASLAGPYSLFDLQIASRTSPTFTIWSDLGSVGVGEGLSLSGAGSTTASGSLAFWSRRDSATTLSAIADGPFNSGAGSALLTPSADQVGTHRIRGRLYLDGVSSIFPYASQNELQIQVEPDGGSQTFTLNVSTTGSGSGTVASNPSGISCPGDCSQSYTAGTNVRLTPTASSGSTFLRWGGACSAAGSGTCTLAMTQARSASAEFAESTGPGVLLSEDFNAGIPAGYLAYGGTVTATGGAVRLQGSCLAFPGSFSRTLGLAIDLDFKVDSGSIGDFNLWGLYDVVPNCQNGPTNGYYLGIYPAGSDNTSDNLFRISAGVGTLLDSNPVSISAGQWHHLRYELSSTGQIRVLIDGAVALSATNTSFSSGKFAVRGWGSYTWVDDLTVTTLP